MKKRLTEQDGNHPAAVRGDRWTESSAVSMLYRNGVDVSGNKIYKEPGMGLMLWSAADYLVNYLRYTLVDKEKWGRR